MVYSFDESVMFVVETDASDFSMATTINQAGRPMAFFARTLIVSDRKHSSLAKEAYAIVESLREWRHDLTGYHFTLITNQKSSLAFMLDSKQSGKIKTDKIQRWRIELACYNFDIQF